MGNNVVVNGNENEVCSQPQTLPERGTLPIQCTRGNAAATGRFLTLYRQSNQPSSMYLCQVLAFLAGGCRVGDALGLSMYYVLASLRLLVWVTERLLLPPIPDKVAEHISPHTC